jgi:ABC-2 type transport system permease protein
MNLFLLPLWFLSGAPFPVEGASPALRWIMHLNPVTYAVDGIRQAAYLPAGSPIEAAPLGVCIAVTAAFAAGLLALATWTVGRPLFEGGRGA